MDQGIGNLDNCSDPGTYGDTQERNGVCTDRAGFKEGKGFSLSFSFPF